MSGTSTRRHDGLTHKITAFDEAGSWSIAYLALAIVQDVKTTRRDIVHIYEAFGIVEPSRRMADLRGSQSDA